MLTAMTVDLIREAKAGDQAAFEQMLRPVIEPGYRLACGMLHDPQAAEDAVQEASLLAWRSWASFGRGPRCGPGSWG
jgi:DNA-directed RNA polymerase specialized sigma24 family protein